MRIKVVTRDPLNGSLTTSDEEINNLQDYIKVRRACVSSSKAWLNGFQIIDYGSITDYAYNNAEDILSFLLGDISLEELNERIGN